MSSLFGSRQEHIYASEQIHKNMATMKGTLKT
jgi:hypothetical protein